MSERRPLPDSVERRAEVQQKKLVRWTLYVVALLLLVAVAMLFVGPHTTAP